MQSNYITMQVIQHRNIIIPSLGLGTYQLTGLAGQQAITTALQLGYRHLDTAQMYNNEAEVGRAIAASSLKREEIFVTTKVWPTNLSKSKFIPSVEESLRKLNSDHVDLLLIHWPKDDDTNKQAVDLLAECMEKQYARLIGVSNFSIPQLEQAMSQAPISCNQVEYHPYYGQKQMLDYIHQHNLFLTAYSPFGTGEVLDDNILVATAAKYDRTVSQLILRWLLQQEGVIAIPKASSREHLEENMKVFDFEIEPDDMTQIFLLTRNNKKYS